LTFVTTVRKITNLFFISWYKLKVFNNQQFLINI
jgi:hypothetical protein